MVAAKYKQTELGLIPSDWDVRNISEIADVDPDNLSSATNPDYEFKYISLEDVDNGILRSISEIVFKNAPSRARRKVKKGDILISTVRPNLKSHLLITEDVVNWICSTGFSVLRSKNGIDCTFLYNHFFASTVNVQIENLITGSNYPAINSKEVKALQIPLPPTKAEQTAIASALSDADALISSLEKLIAKKRNIKQGAMQKLLEPKEGWVVKKLGEIFVFHSTANYSKAEMTFDGEIGCLHYGLVHAIENVLFSLEDGVKFYLKDSTTKYELIQDGDVVMVDASEDFLGINKCIELSKVSNQKFIAGLHTYLMRDTNNIFVNKFRGLILNSNAIKQQLLMLAVGMKVYGVSKTQLKEVLISVPPKEEQTRIATILSDMDAEITALETKLEKYRKVKLGMMQNLLTGKIRLV